MPTVESILASPVAVSESLASLASREAVMPSAEVDALALRASAASVSETIPETGTEHVADNESVVSIADNPALEETDVWPLAVSGDCAMDAEAETDTDEAPETESSDSACATEADSNTSDAPDAVSTASDSAAFAHA